MIEKNKWTQEKPTEPGMYFVCIGSKWGGGSNHVILPVLVVGISDSFMVSLPGDEELMDLSEFEWFYPQDMPELPEGIVQKENENG